jgi:ABC-type uncharacterized transport system permease subunit
VSDVDPQLLSDLIVIAAAAGYAGSGAAYFVHISSRGGSERATSVARLLLWLAAGLQLAFVLHYSAAFRVCPMKTMSLALSLGVVVMCVVYLLVPRRFKGDALGTFVVPVALGLLVASRFVGLPDVPSTLRNKLLPLHISSNVLGDAFFVLASGAAAMYLIQEHQLKAKRGATVFGRIPPLDTLDMAAHRFLLIGFAFMTVGAVTGTVWVSKLTIGTPVEVLRVLFGYVSWLVFSAVLLLRSILGWRGRRAAMGTLIGFALSILVVFLYLARTGMESP